MSRPAYRERLTVPLRWWVQTTMLLVSVWLACIVVMVPALAWTISGAFTVLAIGILLFIGRPVVSVEDGVLTAGRAHIPVTLTGPAETLDRTETRTALGVEADARAYLLVRPYLHRSVKVPIVDPNDPTPYWLITTRHPDRLSAALAHRPH